jgi:hypothetical protein
VSLTYTTAPEVTAGTCITSTQWNTLAAAFNDRLRGGVADPTWRIWWRASSVVRQICASSESGSAPVDDYWRYWNLVDPRGGDTPFTCAAGENEVNPLSAFIFGEGSYFGLSSEDNRLTPFPADQGQTLHYYWLAGAGQRGGITSTGETAATAYTAARSTRWLDYSFLLAPFLKGYGGFFPSPLTGIGVARDTPELMAWTAWLLRCVRDDEHYLVPTVYVFSPIAGGSPLVYWPTPCIDYTYNPTDYCYDFDPDSDTNTSAFHANIQSVHYGPSGYILRTVGGTITELPYDEWVEGPYGSGGRLTWSSGRQIDTAFQWYADDFKGATSQRTYGYNVQGVGFDWQTFFTRQYALAPAYGELVADEIVVTYPLFEGDDTLTQDDYLTVTAGGSGEFYQVHTGFCFAGYYAVATGLAGPIQLQALDQNESPATVLATLTLTPEAPEALVYLESAAAAPKLAWQVVNAPGLNEGATIVVEVAELLDLKPQVQDAYLVLRIGTTQGEVTNTLDTVGQDYTSAQAKGAEFLRYGCLINPVALPIQADAGLTQNPIFETFRSHFSENLRFVDRTEPGGTLSLDDYTVDGNGNSVLKFKRYMTFEGSTYDLFKGIAPEGTASEGIRHTAPERGTTNEWVMFMATHRADSDPTWCKHDSYGDVLAHLHDRCTMFDPVLDPLTGAPDLSDHITYGTGGPNSENPSGLRYAASHYSGFNRLNNTTTPSQAFMESCQVYVPDYELDSVTLEGEGANQLVVIRLLGRLRHTSAVSDFSAYGTDINGNLTEGGDVPTYRTDENAIMEYLIDNAGTGKECRVLEGDKAWDADTDECDGSCHPHFHFTRLMPEVWEEEVPNETSDTDDTQAVARPLEWGIFMLQAMCEGYLDPNASGVESCPGLKQADYRWERICQDIAAQTPFTVTPSELSSSTLTWDDSGGGYWTVQYWNSTIPEHWENEETVSGSPYTVDHAGGTYRVVSLSEALHHLVLFPLTVRGDAVEGFGPMSNTCIYASVFNQVSRGLNLLTTARLELPLTIQSRQGAFEKIESWSPSLIYGTGEPCDPPDCIAGRMVGEMWASSVTSAPDPDSQVGDWSAWAAGPPGDSSINSGPHYEEQVSGDALICTESGVFKKGTEVRWQCRVDPSNSYLYAISEHIRTLVQEYPALFVERTRTRRWEEPGTERAITVCDPPVGPNCLSHSVDDFEIVESDCSLIRPGSESGGTDFRADAPPDGEIRYWRSGTECGTGRFIGNHTGPSSLTEWTLSLGEVAVHVPLV